MSEGSHLVSDELPTPAEVRCILSLDMAAQLHGMADLSARSIDEKGTLRQIRRARDSSVLLRLNHAVSQEEMTMSSTEDGLDIVALSNRRPFVYALWVMETARAMEQLWTVFEGIDGQEELGSASDASP
jgi:hypothetical protein